MEQTLAFDSSHVMTTVDFWFDPACPFAWLTSRWMLKVAEVRDIEISWRPMSLAILNESPEAPPEMAEAFQAMRRPLRMLVAVEADHGQQVLIDLYTELGTRMHGEDGLMRSVSTGPSENFIPAMVAGYSHIDEVLAAALEAQGLPQSYLEASRDEALDLVVVESHESVPTAGLEAALIGVPTISIDGGPAFFGPVLTELPADPGAFFDAFVTLVSDPGFFEIKRVAQRPTVATGL